MAFILVNFANADMVGHSGMVEPTVKGVEIVDECLGRLLQAWKTQDDASTLLITADHGNAEKMFDDANRSAAHSSHFKSSSIDSRLEKMEASRQEMITRRDYETLAPSILKIMGIRQPRMMTGIPLV